MGLGHHALELVETVRLVEMAGLDLVGPTPVGDGVEVLRQWCVAEDLGLLVLRVIWQGECEVRGGAAEDEEGGVA